MDRERLPIGVVPVLPGVRGAGVVSQHARRGEEVRVRIRTEDITCVSQGIRPCTETEGGIAAHAEGGGPWGSLARRGGARVRNCLTVPGTRRRQVRPITRELVQPRVRPESVIRRRRAVVVATVLPGIWDDGARRHHARRREEGQVGVQVQDGIHFPGGIRPRADTGRAGAINAGGSGIWGGPA